MQSDPASRDYTIGELVSHSLSLVMEVLNEDDKPLIMVNPSLPLFGSGLTKIKFGLRGRDLSGLNSSKAISDPYLHQKQNVLRFFDDGEPPDNFTLFIAPGERFIFLAYASFPDEELKSFFGDADSSRLRSSTMQLTFQHPFLNSGPDPDLTEHLASRWRRFGRFPVDKDGIYTLVSEPCTTTNWNLVQNRRPNIPAKH
jgi:hypothetical protein